MTCERLVFRTRRDAGPQRNPIGSTGRRRRAPQLGWSTDLVSEIAAASQEQAQGIDQVNTAMAQMDKVTQQNAANAEESASASEQLSAQAEAMNDVIGQLVTLVGGQGKKRRRHAKSEPESTGRSRGSAPSRRHSVMTDDTWHRIADGDGCKVERRPPVKASAPKNPIPLDADEGDFDDFNT